jgi:hypothetical protein
MVQTCDQLPGSFQSQCGGAGKAFQKNDEGLIVWTGGLPTTVGITNNAYGATLAASQGPWGAPAAWGMPIVIRDSTSNAATKPILLLPNGHSLPDFRWSMSHTAKYKRLSAYVLLDAVHGTDVWNEEMHWSFGDFQSNLEDQNGKTVQQAKPLGYYWRVGPPEAAGIGGFYGQLNSNMVSVEDASYLKLRELSLGYHIGRIAGYGDWTLSVVGRNLKTWTHYRGFDPEVGQTGGNNGSAVLSTVDGFGFPNLRTFTVGLTTSF